MFLQKDYPFMLKASTLQFLKELKKNNNKPWFDSNRKKYEDARKDFEQFIQALIDQLSAFDDTISGQTAKSCLFRINRDIRFSKDKSPYKTNFGASINRGGKKSFFAGYYFHCEPGESFAGGGIWMPEPQYLNKVRQEIDYCYDEFKKIIRSSSFKTIYGDLYTGEDVSLSRVPKGYEADNQAAAYLKLKSYIAMRPLEERELTSPHLLKTTIKTYKALKPFVDFINRSLQ